MRARLRRMDRRRSFWPPDRSNGHPGPPTGWGLGLLGIVPSQVSQGTCSHNLVNFCELESEFTGLVGGSVFHTLFVFDFLLGENGFVKGLAGGEQVIDDACQPMRGGGDGLGRAEFGPHVAVGVAEPAVAAGER